MGFPYEFRPGRSQHDALDALANGIKGRKVNCILDADIVAFFDEIDHDWMIRFLEHRIGDNALSVMHWPRDSTAFAFWLFESVGI